MAALLLLGLTACGAEPPEHKPSVLLISVDTLRLDHLSCYGYERETSPVIDGLARDGAVFEDVTSPCPWTLPAHASMLTGLYPAFHGVQEDGTQLSAAVATLAERFRALGHRTLGVVAHVYVSRLFGLERGFDRFDDALLANYTRNPRADEVVDRFLEMIDAEPDAPFFGFVHFFDPHWDYTPPPPFDARFTDPAYDGPVDGTYAVIRTFRPPEHPMPARDLAQLVALYDGEIAWLDSQIGRLLDELRARGRMEDTLVVLTGDHGEEFQEHGLLGHGRTLCGEQLRVPLVVSGHAAFPPGTRRADPVTPVDLVPTLLELAGAAPDPALHGRSLVRAGPERPLFAESIQFGVEMRSVRQGDAKLVQYGEERAFYDLSTDPLEQRRLDEDPTGGALSAVLDEYSARADAGWHLRFHSMVAEPTRCRATIRTEGRILEPRRYFSRILASRGLPPSGTRFERFELSADGSTLELDLTLQSIRGKVGFRTDPPDALVSFELALEGGAPGLGAFLGSGVPLAPGAAVTLAPDDPRVAGAPPDERSSPPGCYVRAVLTSDAAGPATDLSPATRRWLEELGYAGDE